MSGKMPGIKIETVKPQLTMKLLPPVITTGTKSLKIALDTAYDPEYLSKASARITISGNGKKHDIYIPGPIAEHMIATIDISDLAPGYYNISGAVVLSSRKLASWQGTLPVMPAY